MFTDVLLKPLSDTKQDIIEGWPTSPEGGGSLQCSLQVPQSLYSCISLYI